MHLYYYYCYYWYNVVYMFRYHQLSKEGDPIVCLVGLELAM